MQAKQIIMRSNNIERMNHAVLIMRNFIELSSKLLPSLNQLNHKKNLTTIEIVDRNNIIDLYQNYEFINSTSHVLMNSDILRRIQSAFEKLIRNQEAESDIESFKLEYERLQHNWQIIDAN
ncbi:MAG: hypothetical protein ACI9XP_001276 [Lentimonas sp.]|jgi:hypothetical protein